MRDLYARALYKISSQDLYERSLYKSSPQDLFTGPPYERSLYKSSLQDLFTGPPYETQEPHMRHLYYTRSPDIPGPLRSPHYKISSKDLDQDPTRRKYGEGCADEIKIGTALQRERSDTHKLRRGLHEPKQKMPQAERQRHSISKMSTALQPERSDKHKVPRRLHLQTSNRHRATARLKKSEFRPHLDVSLPIRNAIFRCLVTQVLRLPRKNESEAYEVL